MKGDSSSTHNQNEILRIFSTKNGIVEEEDLVQYSSVQLYSALQEVDKERVTKLHPNDRRKVIRSLQVRYQTGRKHSDILSEQCVPVPVRKQEDAGVDPFSSFHLGGPLRFPNCVCFWIQSDKPVLDERINARVDEMVTKGLRNELDLYIETLKKVNR